MVIDANLYWFPEEFFTEPALTEAFLGEMSTAGQNARLTEADDGVREIVLENPPGFPNLNYRQGDYVLERQLADLDEAGVDGAILKVPGCQARMGLSMCRRFNDGMARAAQSSGGRLTPLACVPLADPATALDEVHRCVDDLGFSGIQLSSHYGREYLEADRFAEFFDELDHLGLTVYVHHSPTPVDDASLHDFTNLRRSYGRCVDQTTAIGRELFSGFLSAHPHLRFVHSMLGGGFFSVANLLLPSGHQNGHGRFDSDIAETTRAFREQVYFEMSHAQPWGRSQLECAIKVLGADRVIFGSSYPVNRAWLSEGPDTVRSLDIEEAEIDLVLGGTALEAYGSTAQDTTVRVGGMPS